MSREARFNEVGHCCFLAEGSENVSWCGRLNLPAWHKPADVSTLVCRKTMDERFLLWALTSEVSFGSECLEAASTVSRYSYKAKFCRNNFLQKPEKLFFPVLQGTKDRVRLLTSVPPPIPVWIPSRLILFLPLTLGNHPQNVVANGL